MFPKRTLVLSGAALVLIASQGFRLRRAVLRSATVVRVSQSTPAVARIALSYGSGTRPWSVIIDLLAHNGSSGSATCDSDTTKVDIPLSQPFSGAYTLTTTATYRLLGIPKTIVQTHIGVL